MSFENFDRSCIKHSLIISREGFPQGRIDDETISLLHQNEGCIRKSLFWWRTDRICSGWRQPTTFYSSSSPKILFLLFKRLSLAQVASQLDNISTPPSGSRSGTGSDSESTRKVAAAHIPPIPIRDSAIRHKFPGLERRKFALPQRYETLNDSDDSQVNVAKKREKLGS